MKTRFLKMMALSVCCIAILGACCKIEVVTRDGDWDPIKLSKSSFVASANGDTLRCQLKNYPSGWFDYVSLNGKYLEIYQSDSAFNFQDIKCRILQAKVTGKNICVIVEPNNTHYSRFIEVGIECGDAFSHISIVQDCK
ncbi:MAG: hypothetical protein MJ069_10090 [Salinivirgaceae bacterium]|nr:hypothetical protein [Salinivirgaceae bacterium]